MQIDRPKLVGRCPVCGKLFEAQRRSKRYCSNSCRVRAQKRRAKEAGR
jgi:predicted nucleic acid-binding Zn ribbon protein